MIQRLVGDGTEISLHFADNEVCSKKDQYPPPHGSSSLSYAIFAHGISSFLGLEIYNVFDTSKMGVYKFELILNPNQVLANLKY